jgi:hypothetical protein
VRIGNTSIAKAAVEHQMLVIAGEVSTVAGKPEPPVPDPPRYSVCLAFRQKYPSTFETDPEGASTSKLRAECESEFQKEKLKALYYLVSNAWVEGEAGELGVTATNGEVEQELAQLIAHAPSEAEARRVLVGTRGTPADLRDAIKLDVLMRKIQKELERQLGQQATPARRQQALNAFGARYQRKWTARTQCSSENLVRLCRNFRPPGVGAEFVPPAVPLTNLTAE